MSLFSLVKRFLLLCGLLAGLGFIAPAAFAANSGCVSSPAIPGLATLGSVAVDATVPVGSIIPGTERYFSFSGNCSSISAVPQGSVIITCYYGTGAEVAGMPGVYNTGVTGIGITLINSAGVRISGGGAACDTRNTPLGYISNTSAKTYSISMTLALVKTSNTVGTGSLVQAQTKFGIGMYNTGYGIGSNADSSVSYAGTINYRSITCSFSAITPVPLPKVPRSDFNGIGSTAGDKNFTVPVTCNSPANVSAYMTSAGYLSKPNGVLALTSATGNAGGVGIQVIYNGSPVAFDSYFNVGSIISAGGTLNIPFVARYYQAASPVTPGIANATATITMAYQ
ncbi:fimbrial protein [Scandinavium sp. V105_16]|uniref:Fimbrial protein n=1 Tax=Scandinavium lactucae TaxID=3095028 RepID=A0AAJ2S519_9ENTR|nr:MULTISPECIES: fimbrial protein [unclassified Scandinavium]MDX6018762.1 fimbrial protein [Scandinavium sp. V105_16]MDX6030277.1 fimbrial protein [Scandinavium sp. V105_12]MDX6039057.1 fimbrial protein [Scandinavium sp. V105_6]MDX6050128.1 fimbrial protein [Scandinavium sp. V105_1]